MKVKMVQHIARAVHYTVHIILVMAAVAFTMLLLPDFWCLVLQAHRLATVTQAWRDSGPHNTLLGKLRQHLAAAGLLAPLREPLDECGVPGGDGWKQFLQLMFLPEDRLACMERQVQLAREEHVAFGTTLLLAAACFGLLSVFLLEWACAEHNFARRHHQPPEDTQDDLLSSEESEAEVEDDLPPDADREDNLPEAEEAEDDLPPDADMEDNLPEAEEVEDDLPPDADREDNLPEVEEVEDDLHPDADMEDNLPEEEEAEDDLPPDADREDNLPDAEEVEDDLPPDADKEDNLPEVEEVEDDLPPDADREDNLPEVEEVEDDLPPDADREDILPEVEEVEDDRPPDADREAVLPEAEVMHIVPPEDQGEGILPQKEEQGHLPTQEATPEGDAPIQAPTDPERESVQEEGRQVRRSLHVPPYLRERLVGSDECFLEDLRRRHSVLIFMDPVKRRMHVKGAEKDVVECCAAVKALLAEWRQHDATLAS